MADDKIYAIIDYEDDYVQPLILEALKAKIPPELLVLIKDVAELPSPNSRLLQWRQYESIDFDHLLDNPSTSLANSYVIRKALIRKHYLSATVAHWLTKNPESVLRKYTKPSVDFEVDYAEFLDEALDAAEAWELRESWARNEGKGDDEKEWWILKPGMSDRGQGIRLFSSEEELTAIFEEWDPPSDDEDDDDSNGEPQSSPTSTPPPSSSSNPAPTNTNGIITSQLRHFVVQPYIHPPLLLPPPHPSSNRKFHLRTYVLATGSLRIAVYKPMLALFAGQTYSAPTPSTTTSPTALARHLTNTCLQSGEREGSVHSFWSLPSTLPNLPAQSDWKRSVFEQVCEATAQVFEAAARAMSVHFQTLPNAFEVFGVDFMVDETGGVCLLEVNAFPDFAQTGGELRGVVGGLVEGVVGRGLKGVFAVGGGKDGADDGEQEEDDGFVTVLDVDLGRR
ncbi:hypothetical protein MBLNU230_g2047t1 [Neophaeotheca triangularis]